VVVGQRIPLLRDRTDDLDPTAINRPSGRGAEVGVGQSRAKHAFHDGRGFALRLGCDIQGATRHCSEAAAFDIARGTSQNQRVVTELAESSVAPEAQKTSDRAGPMIVVDVGGGRGLTDGTEPVLHVQHRVHVGDRHAIRVPEVIATACR
jgi:hypothetical protein